MPAYDATVASYRQTTLTAFQQVEDNLAALRILEQEADEQRRAVESAQLSLQLFTNRYRGGVDNYLQVITAQTVAAREPAERDRHPAAPDRRQRAAGEGDRRWMGRRGAAAPMK